MNLLNLMTSAFLGIILWKMVQIFKQHLAWWQIYFKITPIGQIHLLYGHLHLFHTAHELFMAVIKITEQTKTKMVGMWVSFFFPVIFPIHPDTSKVIMKSSEPKATQIGGGYSSLPPWLGEGLLINHGKKWERNRRLITPAFHFDILKPYVQIYNDTANILLSIFAKKSLKGSLEISEPVSLATFDTMLRCAFSFEGNVQLEGEKHPYVHAVQEITRLAMERLLHPHQYWYPLYLLTANGRKFKKYVDLVHKFDENVIKQRQEAIKKNRSFIYKKHLDFLDILLTAKDNEGKGLTQREIRDEVDTFLFEGHDTTASAITWALYALGKYPHEQEKIYQEVKNILDDRTEVEWEDLAKAKKLSMFIRESMRCYTPVPGISRITTQEIDVDGYKIPPNTEVVILLHALHNRSDIWANPEHFDPTRFEDEKIKTRNPYFHVPFSAGPRNCIGQHFAMNEMKVTLMRVVNEYELTLDEEKPAEIKAEVVMRSKGDGVYLNLKKRATTVNK